MIRPTSGFDPLTETSLERFTRETLTALKIDFIQEASISRMHVDFLIPAKRLVIEVDGDAFHHTQEQRASDARRDFVLRRLGFRVRRIKEVHLTRAAIKRAAS